MADLLQTSAIWRFLSAIGAWLSRCAKNSVILHSIAQCWRESGTKKLLCRLLGAQPLLLQNSRTYAICQRINVALSEKKLLCLAWDDSLTARIYRAVIGALSKSSVIGWLFSGGMQGLLLTVLGSYVLIDWLLRDCFQIALLASVWDELLLVFCAFWLIRRKAGREKAVFTRLNPLDLPILQFITVGVVLMTLIAPYPHIQLDGLRATVQYLLWFFVVTRLIENDRDFTRLYLTLCIAAVILSLHGIYQYIIGVPMPTNWVAQAETAVRTRVFSIFGSPNIMGDFMVMFVPMTVALAYHVKKPLYKALAWLAAIIMCVACLFTMSRGAWVAMAVMIVLFILLVDRKLFWVLFAGCCCLILIPFVRTRIGFLFTDDFVAANTNGGRAGRWFNGLVHLYESDPWTGFGLGMFGGAVAMQNQVLDRVEYFYMDNYYLKILVEMGYIGFASFIVMLLGMIAASVRSIFRTARSAEEYPVYPLACGMFSGLVGVLVHCYFENIFEEPYMMVYFWTIAAMIVYLGFLRRKEPTDPCRA